MATIKISDLHPTGSDLFQDSENYLNELTDDELDLTHGGFSPAVSFVTRAVSGYVVSQVFSLLFKPIKVY
ncbi:hypothetical protein QUA32_17730 [Microcoleus sp. Pol14D6]|uniref:hypothetical protein n=1 Tax=unclassified Microcoleus TaxID=2642155 RepID=UPI002FD5D997